MKAPTKLTATICVERDDEVELTVEGEYWPGCRGVKAHPMDRFAPPDDPDEMEVLSVKDKSGKEIDLSDTELKKAEEALRDAFSDAIDTARQERAEYREDR